MAAVVAVVGMKKPEFVSISNVRDCRRLINHF